MKILVAHGQFAEFGGAERSLQELMKGLSKRGHEIILFTEFPPGTKFDMTWVKKQWLKTPVRIPKMLGIAHGAIKRADAVLVSIHGAFISLPTIWATLIAAKLQGKRAIAYVYEPAVWLDEFSPLWLRLIGSVFIALDSILFRLFRPRSVVVISLIVGQFVKNRYRVKASKVIWPCFQF